MGRIGCIRCEISWRDFVARTYALIAPVHPVCIEFHAVTKWSQMHPNTIQHTKTWVQGPMWWIGCVCREKSRRDFSARNFALIAPVHPILYRVSCSYKTIPNASQHYATHQNMSLGSKGVDWVRSFRKIPTWLCGTSLCINWQCTMFCIEFHAVTKWSQMHPNTIQCTKTWA